jgi:hypothetical protein
VRDRGDYARRVAEFVLQFPPEEIEPLAARFGDTDDFACAEAGAAARVRGHYRRDEFLTVCDWKTSRSRPRVERNDAVAVEAATRIGLGSGGERERMQALIELNGVGVPTASTLLHFAFPEDYPILDVRALESLGYVTTRSVYPIDFWLAYLEACRELAKRHEVSIRTLDKALWQHSREASRSSTGGHIPRGRGPH